MDIDSLTLDLRGIVEIDEDRFFQLCQRHELIRFERNADGTIVVMPLVGALTSNRNCCLTAQLGEWNREEILGVAFGSCTGFTLPNGAVRSPSAAWIKRDRWDSLSREQREVFAPVCPDFVVELRSQRDSLSRLQTKMNEYLENGTRLGWLIDLETQQVEIYRPHREVEVLDAPTSLSGEDVLPGCVLKLESIL
ncbi:MAG: Uma2 family endonuclease [Geitlerinemataceae cyanobacterium]